MKKIMILGSTGSVGRQACDVAARQGWEVTAISAAKNVRLAEEQIRRFRPRFAAMADAGAAEDLKTRVRDLPVTVFPGSRGIAEMIRESPADTAINAVIGTAGLSPTLEIIEKGNARLALANKESLVMAGDLVCGRAKEKGVEITPVDSEHSAIFQCLRCGKRSEATGLIITASGGPFRGRTRRELSSVTVADALAHPTWSMGASITVDSATLMNKGFEVIEAAKLFGFSSDAIEVLVHPQSIVHSIVRFRDNSYAAQMSVPDMRLCVQYAVEYPDRTEAVIPPLDLAAVGRLDFMKPDEETFIPLRLARRALEKGDIAGAVLHAANECAVGLFLEEKIGFTDIFDILERVTDALGHLSGGSLEEITAADASAREETLREAARIAGKRG